MAIFNEMIQHLLHSKVAKAESYLIGGYHNEWLELTYYIETLVSSILLGVIQKWRHPKGGGRGVQEKDLNNSFVYGILQNNPDTVLEPLGLGCKLCTL